MSRPIYRHKKVQGRKLEGDDEEGRRTRTCAGVNDRTIFVHFFFLMGIIIVRVDIPKKEYVHTHPLALSSLLYIIRRRFTQGTHRRRTQTSRSREDAGTSKILGQATRKYLLKCKHTNTNISALSAQKI